MKKWVLFFAFLLALDIGSKHFALESIPPFQSGSYPYGGVPVFHWSGVSFSLNVVGNTGAAWSLFQGYSGLLFLFRSIVIASLFVYLLFFNRGQSPALPLWLITTGAIGNAIDYWAYGFVVDFLHFSFWGHSFPIFNVADSCITIGVITLLIASRMDRLRIVKS